MILSRALDRPIHWYVTAEQHWLKVISGQLKFSDDSTDTVYDLRLLCFGVGSAICSKFFLRIVLVTW
jgi:hypothetical protein